MAEADADIEPAFESRSRVAACHANTQGRRRARGVTIIPRRIRSVAWAIAAAMTKGSATAIPGMVSMWSHRYKPSPPGVFCRLSQRDKTLRLRELGEGGEEDTIREGLVCRVMPRRLFSSHKAGTVLDQAGVLESGRGGCPRMLTVFICEYTSVLVSVVALRHVDVGLAATVPYQCEGDPDEGPHRQHRQRSHGLRTVEEGDRSQAVLVAPTGRYCATCPHGVGIICQDVVAPKNAKPKNHATKSIRRMPAIRRSKRGRRSPQRSPRHRG